MNWRWIALTAVLAAALVSYGAFIGSERGSETAVPPAPPLGYYLKDAVITDTTVSGAARLKIGARLIEQNPADNSVKMQQVRVDYLADAGSPWTLTSDSGFLPAQSKTITFSGNVTLRGETWQQDAVVRTKTLSLETEKQIASTRDDVTIAVGKHNIVSKGLQADLKTQKLKLESSHGRFLSR